MVNVRTCAIIKETKKWGDKDGDKVGARIPPFTQVSRDEKPLR